MKQTFRLIPYFLLIFFIPNLLAEGIDICIGLKDKRGGGSSNLNSITKPTDEGDWVKGSDKAPEFIVTNSYKLKKGDSGKYYLLVDLLLKRYGSKDEKYRKTISISKNGKTSFEPFAGITMTVVSSGFPEAKSSRKD
jgi:hypothetical protein